jgi:hypothetical protein
MPTIESESKDVSPYTYKNGSTGHIPVTDVLLVKGIGAVKHDSLTQREK